MASTMMAIYGHPFSSYTWKALIALYAAEAEHEFRMLGPEEEANSAFIQSAHPAGKFPVLRDGATLVVEATAIVEYVALKHNGKTQLIPADPVEAHNVRMLDRVFDNYVMSNMQRVVSAYLANSEMPDPDEVEAGKFGLQRAYQWLEGWLSTNPAPSHVTLLTCAAAPSLFYADWVERIPADCPRLSAFRAELLALPEVSRCVEDARPYRPYFPLGAPDRD